MDLRVVVGAGGEECECGRGRGFNGPNLPTKVPHEVDLESRVGMREVRDAHVDRGSSGSPLVGQDGGVHCLLVGEQKLRQRVRAEEHTELLAALG